MSCRLIVLWIGAFVVSPLLAQAPPTGPEGIWEGAINLGAIKLRMVFKIAKDGEGYKATFDSPDQGAKDLTFTRVTFDKDTLDLEWKKAATFRGKISDDGKVLKGDWKQSGQAFPMELNRVEKATTAKRPQTPKPPYPYTSEDVTYPSAAAGVELAGTLTLPKGNGPFPAVVLISGSGPQDRDETLFEHKPFAVLADHLTRKGIAVLRFDDRGVGKSTGKFANALAADFAQDTRGGVKYLQSRKEIDPKRIGLMGHSEGGLVAPRVAADNKEIAFVVLLAAPGLPGHQLLSKQIEAVIVSGGASEKEAARARKLNEPLLKVAIGDLEGEALETAMKAAFKSLVDSLTEEERKEAGEEALKSAEARIKVLTSPWMRDFLRFDPRPTLAKVQCPVLAITGEKDVQVDAKENLPEIRKALEAAGNKAVTVRELPGLNHLFQKAKTGSPTEYGTIEETISPEVLKIISGWILDHAKGEMSSLPLVPGYKMTSSLESPHATQAAAADATSLYAISNTTVARYDRVTGKLLGTGTAPDAKHLNSGYLHQGKIYCAHSNYPQKPDESDIRVYDPTTGKLTTFHKFENPPGSLVWCIVRDGRWWCCFAHYGEANAKTMLIRYDDGWKESARWTFPTKVVADWDAMSASGGLFDGDTLLVSHHHFKVLYRLKVPTKPGELEFVEAVDCPFPGQGIAVDPMTKGLIGIDRAKRTIVLAEKPAG